MFYPLFHIIKFIVGFLFTFNRYLCSLIPLNYQKLNNRIKFIFLGLLFVIRLLICIRSIFFMVFTWIFFYCLFNNIGFPFFLFFCFFFFFFDLCFLSIVFFFNIFCIKLFNFVIYLFIFLVKLEKK